MAGASTSRSNPAILANSIIYLMSICVKTASKIVATAE
jgi:hypothetical protein